MKRKYNAFSSLKARLFAATFVLAVGAGFYAQPAHALATDPGFYWTCDQANGNYVCGYSPYGHCYWEDQFGNSGWVSTGQNIGNFMGYDCRQMMPNGPFSAINPD